jgi:hypothetical protein
MAPNLAESQHAQIRDMLLSNRPPAEIADAVLRPRATRRPEAVVTSQRDS